jgi:hypothetical protein
VIAGMVVMRHEGGTLAFEIAGQVVVLKQDAVLERLMPALDLALGLRMIRGAADMLHLLAIQPLHEICRDVRRAVIRQQTRSVPTRGSNSPAPHRRPRARRKASIAAHRRSLAQHPARTRAILPASALRPGSTACDILAITHPGGLVSAAYSQTSLVLSVPRFGAEMNDSLSANPVINRPLTSFGRPSCSSP